MYCTQKQFEHWNKNWIINLILLLYLSVLVNINLISSLFLNFPQACRDRWIIQCGEIKKMHFMHLEGVVVVTQQSATVVGRKRPVKLIDNVINVFTIRSVRDTFADVYCLKSQQNLQAKPKTQQSDTSFGVVLWPLLRVNKVSLTWMTLPPSTSRLRNDLYCVEWGVKLYSLTHSLPQHGRTIHCNDNEIY